VTIVTVYAPPPQLAVTPAELDVLRQLNLLPRDRERDRDRDPDRDEPVPGHVRIGPNKGPRNPNPPAPPEKLVPPVKEKPAEKPRDLPLPGPRPAATAKAEYERLIQLGKDAFAAHQFGRAAERFCQAIAADDQAPAYFLLAQAEITLGKYFDAVDALSAGLKLDPNWPTAPFHPQALYGPDGDDFTEQLQRLQNALARHPDDPVLLFLYAYQLWFDGWRNEALPLFQRAAAVATDKTAIERFLQTK
jgi:tetratricopeptide (TPR) repeat protein